MKTIKSISRNLDNIPSREIYYFGPKLISCSEQRFVKVDGYTFELCFYDIKGNGRIFVKMFDSENNQLFRNLTIILGYCWVAGMSVKFFNDESPLSSKHLEFSTKTKYGLESVLSKFVLVAQRLQKFKAEYPSIQYAYAYLIFLFFQNKDEKIRATKFSFDYNILKKMKSLITEELNDNLNSRSFSKDTIYYKVLYRFSTKQLELLKRKEFIYD